MYTRQVVSQFESSSTLVVQAQTYSVQTILLLDLSGSVDAYINELILAVIGFIETCSAPYNYIGIFGFGGNATDPLVPIIPYTVDATALKSAVEGLQRLLPTDRSTNLYGAVIDIMQEMDERLLSSQAMFTEGIVVVFTDGTDRANAHTLQEAQTAIQLSPAVSYGISVGGEINAGYLNVSI